MNRLALLFLFGFFLLELGAQQTVVKGSVNDGLSFEPISNVTVAFESTEQSLLTDVKGVFVFSSNLPLGEQILVVSKIGYVTKRFPIVVNEGGIVDMSGMTLERDLSYRQDMYTITLSDDELDTNAGGADNISGMLSSSLDVFRKTVAFEFGQSFFRLRGIDSEHAKVLINGIPMNKRYNGRPQWSNWGGLNDVLRQREYSSGLTASSYSFGGILGATNISIRASYMKSGGRLTYSSSNRSYTHRLMATYASGLLKNNWAYTISVGRRWGHEGYQEATNYNANAFFFNVEKQLNARHSLNAVGIYSPNSRGKSGPNTQEVFDIKGTRYNPYWGWQDGKKRNARTKTVEEPILMLNHYWDISSTTKLQTNLAYQFGKIGNSRLDHNGTDIEGTAIVGGGANPSPTYYQKLPSYFERNYPNHLQFAYEAFKAFEDNGQIDWTSIYEANSLRAQNGGNAAYALYEDRTDDTQLTLNTILNSNLNDRVTLNAGVSFQSLKSENFAEVLDLFGASNYLDVDRFAEDIYTAQNDVLNPNRLVGEGGRFKYNFNLYSRAIDAFVQAQFRLYTLDFYIAGALSNVQYQREGLYQNGAFADNSLGKGPNLGFTGFGAKGGLIYKISGKHLCQINGGYTSRAPSIRNSYANARENHTIVPHIKNETLWSTDASYVFRSPLVNTKLTGYYTKVKDANAISFYFADGIGGDNAVFVQEILQGIDTRHIGSELSIEFQVTPSLALKTVAALGEFTYANNPNLYLTTEANNTSDAAGFVNGFKDYGTANLKHYNLAVGPQQAYAFGFEYRDPDFWWFGATANLFSNAYIDISPLTRSSNFTTDFDGNVFNDYDEALAQLLLAQEKFEKYMIVNLNVGKSWKLSQQYLSVFISVNNLLDTVYKTGGFEQGRNANFRQLRDDKALNTSVFAPKYWYGRGTTYFLNMNYRF